MVTYADKPWVQHYDSHLAPSLAPYPEHALHDFLSISAKKYPSNPALITTARLPVLGRQSSSLDYHQLDVLSDALAAALVAMGLEKGERVALILPNCAAFPISYYAVLKAGGVVAATNPSHPPSKMAYQINDSEAEFAITLSLFYETIKGFQAETRLKTVIVANIKEHMPPAAQLLFTAARERKDGHRIDRLHENDCWLRDLLANYLGEKAPASVKADDMALFQYTGGTTGQAKGAMATHKALVANTYQLQAWTGINSGHFGITSEEMLALGALPMFHSYGVIALLTQVIAAGGSIILIPNPRDIDEVVDVIHHYAPNMFLGVPAMFNAVVNHPRVQAGEVSLKSFIFNSSGAAPLATATKRAYEELSGSTISEGFGMSELPVVTHANPIRGQKRAGSIGLPLPDVEVRIVDLDDGSAPVPVGEIGEMIIHAPNMMQGYHNLPTETANTIRELGGKNWLYTGDIAYMDEDGYFFIVDRKKDIALIGGFNVYPNTIEKVLKEHPAVLEVGVAAIPHPERIGQETLKAWVVVKPDQTVTEEELIAHCELHLAPYEVPHCYSFIDELPKTTVGKTLRRELIQMEMEAYEVSAR
jgi:long-chain acyl-CoA synthetase